MRMIPTPSTSKLKAIPMTPFSNWSSSCERTPASPLARAIPSPAWRTVPMSLISTLAAKVSIFWRSSEERTPSKSVMDAPLPEGHVLGFCEAYAPHRSLRPISHRPAIRTHALLEENWPSLQGRRGSRKSYLKPSVLSRRSQSTRAFLESGLPRREQVETPRRGVSLASHRARSGSGASRDIRQYHDFVVVVLPGGQGGSGRGGALKAPTARPPAPHGREARRGREV